MKICIAQIKPTTGDIEKNILHHKKWIAQAVNNLADIVVFPELSIIGYEPQLAEALAVEKDDKRFDEFQTISDAHKITIAVGAPTKFNSCICISLLIFQPHTPRQVYSKKHLHPDEESYFVSGANFPSLKVKNISISFAICYELSIPEHSESAYKNGSEIYIACVAKSAAGVEKSEKNLSEIASKYSMIVLMVNCLGKCDDFESAGRSAVWDTTGTMMAQMDDKEEGLLIFDDENQQIMKIGI